MFVYRDSDGASPTASDSSDTKDDQLPLKVTSWPTASGPQGSTQTSDVRPMTSEVAPSQRAAGGTQWDKTVLLRLCG